MAFTHCKSLKIPEICSTEGPRGRFYQSPKTKLWYPSVTTVTGHQKQDFFSEWRKNPDNAKMAKSAALRGTHLHGIIEKYLKNDPTFCDHTDMLAKFIFEKIQPDIDLIDNIVIQEKSLWSDNLKMAGRVDCIAEYEKILSVVDFKSSTKPKKEEWILNYFEQAACYALMYQEIFNVSINQLVIMIASEDGTIQIFKKPTKNYLKTLHETIRTYWVKNDFDSIQESVKEYA
jgi:hypothetical protein